MFRALAALLIAFAQPADAWEARVGRICELTHETGEAQVYLSFDPAVPLYTIRLTRKGAPWTPGPVFAIRFDGPRGLTISTDRHVIGDGGQSLTVTDTGFGNVLDGLQFNDAATALIADQALSVALDGAAPAVAAFRTCAQGLNA